MHDMTRAHAFTNHITFELLAVVKRTSLIMLRSSIFEYTTSLLPRRLVRSVLYDHLNRDRQTP